MGEDGGIVAVVENVAGVSAEHFEIPGGVVAGETTEDDVAGSRVPVAKLVGWVLGYWCWC